MNIIDRMYLKAVSKMRNLLEDEQGETNIIAIVVVLGIVVALAITFGGKLTELFNGWWDKIQK